MDVQRGAGSQQWFKTGIESGGPAKIQSNQFAGPDIAAFLKDLHDAGAPLTNYSGTFSDRDIRNHPGKASQHAYGNAVDIETGAGMGPDNSPALYAWAKANPETRKAPAVYTTSIRRATGAHDARTAAHRKVMLELQC